MSLVVFKSAPGRDCYVLWRTSVDSPVFIGDRETTSIRLRADGESLGAVAAKLDLADQTGSSYIDGTGWWDDDGFVVDEELFPSGMGSRFLPRAGLEEFTRAASVGDVERMLALTTEMLESGEAR
ncbi:hypothetical protein [Nonomuraea sp. SYSU D8015]|uniref:hypothetical protein n=1 Tax=Nonomuraea sp. SYSU D8015 TaxID=2593644 RepID=UPI001660B21B|nr:hypothetical protein [Nonomuraea sp. SYSU D8015]